MGVDIGSEQHYARLFDWRGMELVFVNPYHIKQSKGMDGNSPKKTDRKDPKTIARLVVEGRRECMIIAGAAVLEYFLIEKGKDDS